MAAMKPKQLLVVVFTLSLLLAHSIADISHRELESAIFALRSNGYNLFGNSIAVSELSVQLLSSNSSNGGFTLLAPPNSALFSLDMSTDSFSYVHSLRFHVIPRRLSFFDLHNLSRSSFPYLETLAPSHILFVASSGDIVSVDGVRVSLPDLYLRSQIAVHGLDGILDFSTDEHFRGFSSSSIPPIEGFPAPIDAFSPKIEGFPAPIDAFSPKIEGFPAPIEGIPAPSPHVFPIPAAFADSPSYEAEFLSPNFSPLFGSTSPIAVDWMPDFVTESPEIERNWNGRRNKKHKSGHDHNHNIHTGEESQGEDYGKGEGRYEEADDYHHGNFAKYNHRPTSTSL